MFQRLIENRINSLLSVAKVVLVTGPRLSGKTILVKKIASPMMVFNHHITCTLRRKRKEISTGKLAKILNCPAECF